MTALTTSDKKHRDDSIVLVEEGRLEAFEKRLNSLNKKAVAFGLEPIKIIQVKDVVYERKFEYVGHDMDKQLSYLVPLKAGEIAECPVLLTRIEIEYPQVKLGNWRVVGKLEAVDSGNLTFSTSSDESDVAELMKHSESCIECEHCKTKRQRKDGYLLRDEESGEYKQVGGTCLRDFTGIDPGAALFLARMSGMVRLAETEFEEFGRSGRINAVSTRQYLADVSFLADKCGFMSSTKARDLNVTATYHNALFLDAAFDDDEALRIQYINEIKKHLEKADAIRQWVSGLSDDDSFNHNVKLLLESDALSRDRKHLAFAAATIPMYNRWLNVSAKIAVDRPSVHVGQPGEKCTMALTVDRVVGFETAYGYSEIVLMHDQHGNQFKWKTSACPQEIKNEGMGHTMEAKFKIKEHDDYQGKAQTAVTHLKVVSWLDLELPMSTPQNDLYRVSMYLQESEAHSKDFSNPIIDAVELTVDELAAEARRVGIAQLRGEGEFKWYVSTPDATGKEFSLYVDRINDREPGANDYLQIAKLMSINVDAEVEVQYEHSVQ